jgi:hypothetical protein
MKEPMAPQIEMHTRPELAIENAHSTIDSFVSSPQLHALAEAFGFGTGNQGSDVDLSQLKAFSNQNWDFRKGAERHNADMSAFEDGQEEYVLRAAEALGMMGDTVPVNSEYDFINVLGGANQSPLLRTRYAKKVMEAGRIKPPYMVLLGSSRRLSGAEKDNTANYAPGAVDEFDLMNAAVEQEFGVSVKDETTLDMKDPRFPVGSTNQDAWRVRYYQTDDGMNILSLSAPQVEGSSRVNTADTYRFMREVVGDEMLDGAKLLNVTTDLFREFQHPDAIRLLGLDTNATIETIGYGGVDRPAKAYLQEINSALNQMKMLADELDKRTTA